jgi:hypothetical protein
LNPDPKHWWEAGDDKTEKDQIDNEMKNQNHWKEAKMKRQER